MSRALRRFEILLPLKFNDGSAVPIELTAKTILELREKFGSRSVNALFMGGAFLQSGCLLAKQIRGRSHKFVEIFCNPALWRNRA